MYALIFSKQFEKDFVKAKRSNFDIAKLESALKMLQSTGTLPFHKYKTHKLKGEWKGALEAHLEPNWLLIWYKKDKEIFLDRTGSHSELFK